MSTHQKISRRTWLKGMAVFSAAAGMSLMLASMAAQAKASKAAVHYRDYPSAMRMCKHMQVLISGGGGRSGMMGCPMMRGGMMGRGMMGGAGACQVVEGRISPMGYCDLYVPA
jgi:hypothetical protein